MSTVIRFQHPGPPTVLIPEQEEIGDPGPGQVRLRHLAIGLNFVDTMFRSGAFEVPVPFVTGVEGAGIIEEVGPDVAGFELGDRVCYFFAPGAYADVRLVPAEALVRLPDDVDFDTAAAALTKGVTAWLAIRHLFPINGGEVVLVQGATGGVGSFVALWAKALGARVIGTGSAAKADELTDRIDQFVSSSEEDFPKRLSAAAPGGVDAVFDFVGAATAQASLAAIKDGGTILPIGAASGSAGYDPDILAERGIRVIGGSAAQIVQGEMLRTAASDVFDALRAGTLGVIQPTRYPLVDAAHAHQDIIDRRQGKLAILVP